MRKFKESIQMKIYFITKWKCSIKAKPNQFSLTENKGLSIIIIIILNLFFSKHISWIYQTFFLYRGWSPFRLLCCAQSLLSCPVLCSPMDRSPPCSSVHGILQARILEYVAIPFSRGSCWPRDQTQVSCFIGILFTVWAIRETLTYPAVAAAAKSLQSCPILWDPMDSSSPGSSVRRIL